MNASSLTVYGLPLDGHAGLHEFLLVAYNRHGRMASTPLEVVTCYYNTSTIQYNIMCLKKCPLHGFSSITYSSLNRSSLFLAHSISLKCMDNFLPHLICVATLPENTLATEQARCFRLGGWLRKDNAIMVWVCLFVCLWVC